MDKSQELELRLKLAFAEAQREEYLRNWATEITRANTSHKWCVLAFFGWFVTVCLWIWLSIVKAMLAV